VWSLLVVLLLFRQGMIHRVRSTDLLGKQQRAG
jgi:hypothetical protein